MASKKYDLVVKVGSYEKNGETKNKYQNIGAVIQGDNGPYIIMDRTFNPAGVPNPENRENFIVSLFEPRDNNQQNQQPQGQQQNQQPQGGGGQPDFDQDFEDDIPF